MGQSDNSRFVLEPGQVWERVAPNGQVLGARRIAKVSVLDDAVTFEDEPVEGHHPLVVEPRGAVFKLFYGCDASYRLRRAG